MYYVRMTTPETTPETAPQAEEAEEVTGYGYLTDAEREAAIKAHAKAVAENTTQSHPKA